MLIRLLMGCAYVCLLVNELHAQIPSNPVKDTLQSDGYAYRPRSGFKLFEWDRALLKFSPKEISRDIYHQPNTSTY
jgi:hypothetical protein